MYKAVFVDDEYLTRDAISRNTPWEEVDFVLVGTAENGRAAIALIEEVKPDLILTDICMPVLDGIGLAAYVHEHHPEIMVVIISGYDDFDYAKQAMRYEVADYILKPITSVELVEELGKIRKKLDAAAEKRGQLEKIQQEYRKNMPILRNHFLSRLLEGNYPPGDILPRLEYFGLQTAGRFQAAAMIELEDASAFLELYPDSTQELLEFSVANISEELVRENPHVIFLQNTENRSICIFSEDSEASLQREIEKTGNSIVDAMGHFMKMKVCILVGQTVTGPENWAASYAGTLRARENRFLLEERVFVYEKDFSGREGNGFLRTSFWVDKLVLSIKLNRLAELREDTSLMFREFRESGCDRKKLLLHIQNMVLTILINLEDNEVDIGREAEEADFINHLSEYRHLADVEVCFLEFCNKLSSDIAGKRESVNQKQAVLALDYMEKNYSNVNLSLGSVCSHLCVSTSYFSTIFKNATGETFVEALTRIRMEKAKGLLEASNMKSYEVALAVGYNDPHYFSSIFKKHTGMTPTEYAKQLRK